MKKRLIPIIAAVVLIVIVVLVSLFTGILDKYSYSDKEADLNSYFGIVSENDAAVILNSELSEAKARVIDGVCYLEAGMVREYLNSRFYADTNERLLLYTTPEQIIRAQFDSAEYTAGEEPRAEDYVIAVQDGEKLYVALDYVRKFTNFSYELFTEPNRVEIVTTWPEKTVADMNKDTALRVQGGVKSDILKYLKQGEKVSVLEVMDNWCKVKTDDAFIGYIENKRIENARPESDTPVADAETPVYANITKDHRINLAWHQTTNETANAMISNLLAQTEGINTLSPTWFSLADNNGTILSIASREYVDTVHSMGIEVWGLVDNFNQDVSTLEILSYTSKRAFLIEQLMAAAEEYGLDGINVDFEQLSGETGIHFIEFIRELSIACRARGLVLSVDNYVPAAYTDHYDRKEQGIVADYVIIMGYDEHYAGSEEAGPVASIDFVRSGIEKTLAEVPPGKVINGIPLYTRIWKENPKTEDELAQEDPNSKYIPYKLESEAVGMAAAAQFLADNGVTPAWEEESGTNYGAFTKDGVTYEVWLEDADSVAKKLDCMAEYGLAGVAVWKLGMEDKAVWGLIGDYVNK